MFGSYRWSFSNFFRRQDGGCLNKYYTVKSDIERQIEAFNNIKGKKVHTEWDRLNTFIINADKELKECYKNGHVKVKLTDVDEINNFINKCNRNRTCKNRATPANLPPIIKHTTQRTCNKGEKCKKKTAVTDDVKSQSRSVSGGANPPSSEIKIPQEQGQNQADGQKPRRESVVSQSQSITMPSGSSVGTNVNTSQEIVNHHSTTSAVVENQERPLNASSPPGNRGMDSPPSDHSLQRISGETSDLTYTSTGEILNSKDIQTNQYSGKTLDANNPQTQDSAGNVTAEQTSGGKDITSEIAHNLSPTESTSGSVQRVEVDPHPTATVGGSTSTVFSDSGKTGSEAVSSASLASASRVVGNNGVTYVAISNDFKAPDGEIKSDKVSHDHIYGSEGLCTEGTCNEAQNTEITSNNNNNDTLGTLSRVFNVIQENKDNMIKASAPMGIVMLLGLLFKYTSLWRVLTKKNRKKGAGIIEELNSVLQEPSIMDDERSIPFSYGAFEYST
ncbi:unnamed protein product [Plasmodium vivax]|uniref:(malaria parasite P. vivax) hypothetical protein n=1 Tax=Plasmodium vivax TaxID=5855 RepID=A0A8S4HGX4_PLAVI|nr:unnamed protein product [Plasmodium vivax]